MKQIDLYAGSDVSFSVKVLRIGTCCDSLVVGTDGPPAPVLPGAIERAVQRENLEYSHTKAQFGVEYFRFMKSLAQSNVPLVTDDRPDITVWILSYSISIAFI